MVKWQLRQILVFIWNLSPCWNLPKKSTFPMDPILSWFHSLSPDFVYVYRTHTPVLPPEYWMTISIKEEIQEKKCISSPIKFPISPSSFSSLKWSKPISVESRIYTCHSFFQLDTLPHLLTFPFHVPHKSFQVCCGPQLASKLKIRASLT